MHETVQRGGHGRALFEEMLHKENVHPAKCAYDRPSTKLLGFLSKHFGLRNYIPQNNNYVVYQQYWQEMSTIYKPFIAPPKAPITQSSQAQAAEPSKGAAPGKQTRTVRFADEEPPVQQPAPQPTAQQIQPEANYSTAPVQENVARASSYGKMASADDGKFGRYPGSQARDTMA